MLTWQSKSGKKWQSFIYDVSFEEKKALQTMAVVLKRNQSKMKPGMHICKKIANINEKVREQENYSS